MKMRAGWLLQYSHLEQWAFQAHRPSAPLSTSLSPRTGSPPWGQTDRWRPLSTHESHTAAEAFNPPKTCSGQRKLDKGWPKIRNPTYSIIWSSCRSSLHIKITKKLKFKLVCWINYPVFFSHFAFLFGHILYKERHRESWFRTAHPMTTQLIHIAQ